MKSKDEIHFRYGNDFRLRLIYKRKRERKKKHKRVEGYEELELKKNKH